MNVVSTVWQVNLYRMFTPINCRTLAKRETELLKQSDEKSPNSLSLFLKVPKALAWGEKRSFFSRRSVEKRKEKKITRTKQAQRHMNNDIAGYLIWSTFRYVRETAVSKKKRKIPFSSPKTKTHFTHFHEPRRFAIIVYKQRTAKEMYAHRKTSQWKRRRDEKNTQPHP